MEYAYSFDGESYVGTFGSEKDALDEAVDMLNSRNEDDECNIYVGVCECFSPHINVDYVIEQIQDNAYDESGEFSDDYLVHVKREHKDELSDSLNKVFSEWAEKYKYTPNWFNVNSYNVYLYKDGSAVLL